MNEGGEPPMNSAFLCKELLQELTKGFNNETGKNPPRYRQWARKERHGFWGGYMVGVVVCKCEPGKAWAAMSGETVDGFTDAVGKLPGGVTPITDSLSARPLCGRKQIVSGPAVKEESDWEVFRPDYRLREGGSTEAGGIQQPGSCAGAKLMTKCRMREIHDRDVVPSAVEPQRLDRNLQVLFARAHAGALAGISKAGGTKFCRTRPPPTASESSNASAATETPSARVNPWRRAIPA